MWVRLANCYDGFPLELENRPFEEERRYQLSITLVAS